MDTLLPLFAGLTSASFIARFAVRTVRFREIERMRLESLLSNFPATIRFQAFHMLSGALVLAVGFRFAELRWIWLGLAALGGLTSGVLLGFSALAAARPHLVPSTDTPIEERVERGVKTAWKTQPINALLILAWLYSWRWVAT